MTLKKIAICAAWVVFATISAHLAQAGSKGVSSSAPGHSTTVQPGDPGKSGNSPGDLKNNSGAKDAKTFAPGQSNKNKK
jgi:hypothetical protein